MFSTLLISFLLLCGGGMSDIHTLHWATSAGASGYRVYVAAPNGTWVEIADLPDTQLALDFCTFPPHTNFIVTAYNSAGESSTEHGAWAGAGYDPY